MIFKGFLFARIGLRSKNESKKKVQQKHSTHLLVNVVGSLNVT